MTDLVTLVRSDLSGPGIRRRRHGRGFRYLGPEGTPLRDPEVLTRVKALVIPPAWEDVWISAAPDGHIQAVGTDAAGRRQYRYHDRWREQRDREKHDRVLEFGAVLPRVRTVVLDHLDGRTLSRDEIVAAAIAVADAEGPGAISMRRIAREVNAGAMSLYWHVESKEDLLELMLDQLEAEIDAPEPTSDWRADLRGYARDMRAVLMRHPWAADLIFAHPPTGPHDARNGDRMFGVFLGLGVDTRTAVWLAMTFLTYVTGAVQQQIREIQVQREMDAGYASLSDEELRRLSDEERAEKRRKGCRRWRAQAMRGRGW